MAEMARVVLDLEMMYNAMYVEVVCMPKMIRKQVYIAPEHEGRLKELAQTRGVSEAELIREALDRELGLVMSKASHPQRLDATAWEAEVRAIEKLISHGPLPGGRRWTRQALYEEDSDHHGRTD